MRQAAGLQLKKNGAETQGVALGWYEPGRWPGKTPSGPLNENGGDVGNDKPYSRGLILEKFPEVKRLSSSEKLIFVSELWNDLEACRGLLARVPED